MFFELLEKFQSFMGSGLIVLWFLVCVIYLFLFEKKKEVRILFVYLPVIVLILFFNPLFARFTLRYLDNAIYYRFLWLLPVTPVIAYTATELYGKMRGKWRYYFAAGVMVLILVSGKLIYNSPYFDVAENIYHMPQSVIDICDRIEYKGREVMAVFPAEMLPYVKQYNGTICMPYGREMLTEAWVWNSLYNLMEEREAIDAAVFAQEARDRQCVYIIVSENKKITGSMEACDYEKYAEIDGYIVYKDTTVDLSY